MRNTRFNKFIILTLISWLSITGIFAQLYPAVFDMNTLDGTNGFAIPGLEASSQFGAETKFIGDINNDGLEDISIGVELATVNGLVRAGVAYIIFGSSTGLPSNFDVTTLNGTNGFIVEGVATDERRGTSVSGPGDINGDGIDDLIVLGNDKAIVLYGKTTAFNTQINVNDIDGTNGFLINHSQRYEVNALGDVNGDGFNDFILSAGIGGQAWVVFGRSTNFPASVDSSWLDGTKGFKTNSFPGTRPAFFAGGAGDINNDGYDDILIGNWDSSNPAVSYLLFGKGTPFPALVDLTSLDGTDGFSIDNTGGNFLTFVGPLGDINNDGIDDFFSEVDAIYGSTSPFPAHIPLSSVSDGTYGFILPGGLTSAPIGDINQDGINDFVSVYNSGTAYIIFGSSTGFPDPLDETTLDGTNGFIIEELNASNISRPVSGGGDINGDGISDFILGSPGTPPSNTGMAYVVFGGDYYAMPLNTSYPQAINETTTGFTLLVNGSETGTIHYAIYPGNFSSTVTYDDILNGTNAITDGNFLMNSANTDVSEIISSLTAGTAYDVYLFLEDNAGNQGEVYQLDDVTTIDSSLGISDNIIEGFNFYPNPAYRKINLKATHTINLVEVYNIMGQKIISKHFDTNEVSFNISTINKGVYIMKISTTNNELTSFRMIKI